ncbi:MAG: 23S rRNA (uracil(1939)-C(5))-methyltransferase RlmD [Flavobacteriales bacterium TMED113]|nr:MAG: 23S rRNA (uracil(1939)-C(5))-methyltransferase RlmD [Flavobacteriales bacterium TMED113]
MEKIFTRPKKGEELIGTVIDMAYGGKGIVKINMGERDYIIFISNTITGQKIKFKIIKRKENYAEGRLLEIISKSDLEIDIPYQSISGAPYSTLDLNYQQQLKKNQVFELFTKIGGIEEIEKKFDSFIKSPSVWHYRNKMDYSFSSIGYNKKLKEIVDEFSLGFKKINTWWIVENLDKDSGLFDKKWEDSIKDIRKYCIETGLPAWNIPQKKGFFRNLVVRKSIINNNFLIELITSSENEKKFKKNDFCEKILNLHPNRIEGIIHTINDNISDRVDYSKVNSKLLFGSDKIFESILNLKFEISMSSFFQTNPKSAEKLYSQVYEYVFEKNISENDIILDLFCGTGTITQIIASQNPSLKVIGVDIVEKAIENAIKSTKKNKITNASYFAGDVGKFLYKKNELINNIHSVIIDPPRSGVSKKSLKKIIELNTKKIIYVSCDPSTQARDINFLESNGYDLIKFCLIDQFPHTYHIETIALLQKKNI